MTGETALRLYTELEADEVEYDDLEAEEEEWEDENTPPKAAHSRYSVRLDAFDDRSGERDYRLRVTLHPWLGGNEAALAIEWAVTQARLADDVKGIAIQNNGVEFS